MSVAALLSLPACARAQDVEPFPAAQAEAAPPLTSQNEQVQDAPHGVEADDTLNCPLPPTRAPYARATAPDSSVAQPALEAEAGNLTFHRHTGELLGTDAIHLYHRDIEMTAEHLRYQVDRRTGVLENAQYQLLRQAGAGRADEVRWSEDAILTLSNATFSTCLDADPDWHLQASRIELDRDAQIGRAWHSTFRIGAVPVLYWPYISFPLSDQRKSGFLMPEFRRDQNTGQIIAVPFYLNLAPRTDLTLAPVWYQFRGEGLDLEWRYLSQQHTGVLDVEWLSDDRIAQRDRYSARFRQSGQLAPDVLFRVDLNAVSDDFYFEDFGDSLLESSQPRLYSVAEVTYIQPGWQARLLAENEVILSSARDEVYSRQPELRLHSERALGYGFAQEMDTTLAHFIHPNDTQFPATTRLDMDYRLAWRYSWRRGYIQPEASARLTRYDIASNGSESRMLPMFTLDSGLYFERTFGAPERPHWHTIEPRLLYTHIPYRDQSSLPLLDTERVTFDSSGLLQGNRFLGADRIGDTHQIAFMLGQRFLAPETQRSLVRLNLGKILYLQNRQVQLNALDPVETSRFSGTLLELEWTPTARWRTVLEGLTSPQNQSLERGRLAFWYQPGQRQFIHLSRSYSRAINATEDEVDDLSVAFAYPFRTHLAGYGKMSYSFLHEELRETFLGLEYQTCCWSMRTQWSRFIPNVAARQTIRNTFSVNFEIRGLGGREKKGITKWIENDTLEDYRD